jgi:hypothetical protein
MLGMALFSRLAGRLCGLAAILLVSGCASFGGRSAETAPSWTQPWREKTEDTNGVGLDARAKDIERNLGIY